MSDISELKALIVDDSIPYASVLRRILEAGMGMQGVVHCASLPEAEALLRAHPAQFSLLFIDFRFPAGGTGVELLERLKGTLPATTLPFLITSEPTPENAKRALAAGAKGVVAKPFDRQQLMSQLQRALRSDVQND